MNPDYACSRLHIDERLPFAMSVMSSALQRDAQQSTCKSSSQIELEEASSASERTVGTPCPDRFAYLINNATKVKALNATHAFTVRAN